MRRKPETKRLKKKKPPWMNEPECLTKKMVWFNGILPSIFIRKLSIDQRSML